MGPHEEAEIQCKGLRHMKIFVLREDPCAEKERVRSKVTPRNVEMELKRREELSKRWSWRSA